jgi:hypothetical protein
VYPNFPDPDLQDWAHAYYGGNYDRLLRVKARFDPGNFWFGDAAEGDFEAEGGELADVTVGLAAGAGPAFVVVGAEVLIAGAGAGQQRVVDLQLGVADGDLGFKLAAAAGQPPAAGAFAGGGAARGDGALAGDAGEHTPDAAAG